MKFVNALSERGGVETFLRKRGIWLLLAFALGYYGYYHNVWPGPGGEGGVAALLSQRLLEGQRPIVDTFLGYNVLWFYPIVGIFKVLGPHYLAMRLFFFLLCTITGLLAQRIILKCTGKAWMALLTGVLVILVPGQTYRNYMAFLAVLNMSVFLSALVLPAKNLRWRLLWIFLAGVTLGIAYLVRIDVGYFLSFILLGLLAAYPFGDPDHLPLPRRVLVALLGLLLAASGLLLTHLPVYRDAVNRGFGPEFTGQYRQWPAMIGSFSARMIEAATSSIRASLERPGQPAAVEASPSRAATPAGKLASPVETRSAPPPLEKTLKITHGAQQRISISSPKARDKIMALNLYLPIPLSLMLAAGGMIGWLLALGCGDRRGASSWLSGLTALGCSLVLFPQYFFWQPNMVHLSEFMVPMTVTILLSSLLAAETWRCGGWRRIPAGIYLALALISLLLYYVNACQSGGSGGIAVSQHKSLRFRAANGVTVIMNPREFRENSAIRDLVAAVSDPGEFVICYPYYPEINFYTDRPSYERNVYADNDIPGDKFHRELLANVGRHHPVVFVINNWDINGTEDSRFCNWAWESYRYLTQNYTLGYKHGDFEVYVRPDRAARIPKKFRLEEKSGPTP